MHTANQKKKHLNTNVRVKTAFVYNYYILNVYTIINYRFYSSFMQRFDSKYSLFCCEPNHLNFQ